MLSSFAYGAVCFSIIRERLNLDSIGSDRSNNLLLRSIYKLIIICKAILIVCKAKFKSSTNSNRPGGNHTQITNFAHICYKK